MTCVLIKAALAVVCLTSVEIMLMIIILLIDAYGFVVCSVFTRQLCIWL